MSSPEPHADCCICPRLHAFLSEARGREPSWHNAPVPSFGRDDASLLVVGLAPGLSGANRTGRPFTGDHAGVLLYETLLTHGFARGTYGADPGDGLVLLDCMISNAVRCVPPQNKPTPAEIKNCNEFLKARISSLPNLKSVVALGRIAHDAVLTALSQRKAAYPFVHGAHHELPTGVTMIDSYHCSRYNTNTGVLTPRMFDEIFAAARRLIGAPR